jgi:hypothetical protein
MTTSEIALLDTNILVYAADTTSAFHHPAGESRLSISARGNWPSSRAVSGQRPGPPFRE